MRVRREYCSMVPRILFFLGRQRVGGRGAPQGLCVVLIACCLPSTEWGGRKGRAFLYVAVPHT